VIEVRNAWRRGGTTAPPCLQEPAQIGSVHHAVVVDVGWADGLGIAEIGQAELREAAAERGAGFADVAAAPSAEVLSAIEIAAAALGAHEDLAAVPQAGGDLEGAAGERGALVLVTGQRAAVAVGEAGLIAPAPAGGLRAAGADATERIAVGLAGAVERGDLDAADVPLALAAEGIDLADRLAARGVAAERCRVGRAAGAGAAGNLRVAARGRQAGGQVRAGHLGYGDAHRIPLGLAAVRQLGAYRVAAGDIMAGWKIVRFTAVARESAAAAARTILNGEPNTRRPPAKRGRAAQWEQLAHDLATYGVGAAAGEVNRAAVLRLRRSALRRGPAHEQAHGEQDVGTGGSHRSAPFHPVQLSVRIARSALSTSPS